MAGSPTPNSISPDHSYHVPEQKQQDDRRAGKQGLGHQDGRSRLPREDHRQPREGATSALRSTSRSRTGSTRSTDASGRAIVNGNTLPRAQHPLGVRPSQGTPWPDHQDRRSTFGLKDAGPVEGVDELGMSIGRDRSRHAEEGGCGDCLGGPPDL